MARPLTKTKEDGTLYKRPSVVEAQIDAAVQLSRSDLQARLLITDRNDPGYLRSECLVHLAREGRRSIDQQLMNSVLPVLLGRCEAILRGKIQDDSVPDAADLRQEILKNLMELFATDGTDDFPNELDFYECRFNKAFMALRINAVRIDKRRRKHSIAVVDLPLSDTAGDPAPYEDSLARISENFRALPTQEWDAFREPFLRAIEDLPDDERNAVILVHVLGYVEESEDPEKETAATLCNCTGRTIRNRLKRAAAKLSRFKEDL